MRSMAMAVSARIIEVGWAQREGTDACRRTGCCTYEAALQANLPGEE
jgi:hypothetical protein